MRFNFWSCRPLLLSAVAALFFMFVVGCGTFAFGESLPGVPDLPVGIGDSDGQAEACTNAMKNAVSSQGFTDPEDVNLLISAIQSQNDGCGVPIWNPLATGDAGADECLRGMLRDQVTAGMMGASGDGAVFVSMQASDGTPTGEGCFMYHAKRGTWVESGLDHARWYMGENRCRRAPGSMIDELDPSCVVD